LRDVCISPDWKVYIAVSNRDGRGSPKADDDKIVEIAPVSTNISETSKENVLTIFPNPGKDFVYVSYPASEKTEVIYSLYNVSGQILKAGTLKSNPEKILLPANYEGVAILRIVFDNKVFSEKLLIAR
jgi:hypothetical protein